MPNEHLTPFQLESASYIYDYPGKGHDKVFANDILGLYALFDGAGNDRHSRIAEAYLHGQLEDGHAIDEASFLDLAVEVNNLPGMGMSAGAMIHIIGGEIITLNRGDTSIFIDQPGPGFTVLGHEPTTYRGNLIDTKNFFGYKPTDTKTTHDLMRTTMPTHRQFTVLAVSDGVYDDDGRGASLDELAAILHAGRTQTAQLLAQTVFAAIGNLYDDASVLVIKGSYDPDNTIDK